MDKISQLEGHSSPAVKSYVSTTNPGHLYNPAAAELILVAHHGGNAA